MSYILPSTCKDSDGFNALHHAILNERKEIAQRIFQKRDDTLTMTKQSDNMGFTPLHWSIASNKMDLAIYLMETNPNIHACDHRGETILFMAAKCNNIQLVQLILKYGASKSVQNHAVSIIMHYSLKTMLLGRISLSICKNGGNGEAFAL
jgi:ankyrin repeat protein